MNLYKLHSNPDELIGYTDRDFYFGAEARELILQGKEVTKVIGTLDLNGTPITSLPDNLTVGGALYLAETLITSLPDNLKVGGDLDLNGTPITSLPDNLTVGGDLDLYDTPITSLPDNLTVGEDLYIGRTPNLDKDNLPSSLVVKGGIHTKLFHT
jgi:hypothetical protein